MRAERTTCKTFMFKIWKIYNLTTKIRKIQYEQENITGKDQGLVFRYACPS